MRKWVLFICGVMLLVGCQKNEPIADDKPQESQFNWDKKYLGNEAIDVSDEDYLTLFQQASEEGETLGYTPILVEVSNTLEENVSFVKEKYGTYGDMQKALLKKADKVNMEDDFAKYEKDNKAFAQWTKAKSNVASFEAFSEVTLLSDTIYMVKVEDDPYRVFAYVPMGGFNDCLSNEQLIATFKLWYEQFGIVPVSIGFDNVQFYFTQELSDKQIKTLAKQLYFVNQDSVEMEYPSLADMMKGIKNSSCWMLWWD